MAWQLSARSSAIGVVLCIWVSAWMLAFAAEPFVPEPALHRCAFTATRATKPSNNCNGSHGCAVVFASVATPMHALQYVVVVV